MASNLNKGTAFKSLTLGTLVLTNAQYDELFDIVAGKVASVGATANKGIEVGGTATAPTVGIKLAAGETVLGFDANGGLKATVPAAAEYSVTKQATADAGYAATYQLTKDGTAVGTKINIPKDQFLESAELVNQDGDGNEGKFIKLTFAVTTTEGATPGKSIVYLNVNDLVDVYTSGSVAGDQIVVAVDSTTNKITATLSNNSVTNAQLAGNIEQTKLAAALSTKIDNGAAAKTAVDAILDGTEIDSFADVEAKLATKQDNLTFDNAPTSGSANPVKSGGVYSALAEKADKIGTVTDATTVTDLITALGGSFSD